MMKFLILLALCSGVALATPRQYTFMDADMNTF
jgi:hypothetical protein